MTELAIFREYEPHELGGDGYPRVWHTGLMWGDSGAEAILGAGGTAGVKDVVRTRAGNRCIRCLHPYREGQFTWEEATRMEGPPPDVKELTGMPGADMSLIRSGRATHWSPCDEQCRHSAPVRVRDALLPTPHVEQSPPLTDARVPVDWRYSWPTLAREALAIVDDPAAVPVAAGRLFADGNDVEAAWRILTVHHLNGRKHDCRWWNLQSLCQRCHLYIQRTVILERVYPFEHEEWFKPYAAGFYAYAYLGETLTRGQTMSRLDELLALERLA